MKLFCIQILNYRGITLVSVVYKLYNSCLNSRLVKSAEDDPISDEQNRFPFCNKVESEIHVMLRCEIYSDLKNDLLSAAYSIRRDLLDLTNNEKLSF